MAAIPLPKAPRPVEGRSIVLKYKASSLNIKAGRAVKIVAGSRVVDVADHSAVGEVVGIALQTPTYVGQDIDVCVFGELQGWAGLEAPLGLFAFTAGDLAPYDDVAAGKFAHQVATVTGPDTIFVRVQTSATAKA